LANAASSGEVFIDPPITPASSVLRTCVARPRDLSRRFVVARQSATHGIDEAKLDRMEDRFVNVGKSERVGKANQFFFDGVHPINAA
jgi:hypothetical protein